MARSTSSKRPRASAEDVTLDLPPFPGFDRKGFQFLKEIAQNNVREWLTDERKSIYRDHLVEPMKQLLGELRMRFAEEGLPYTPDPAASLFRLYRDTRFSKDKRPFKTNIGAVVPFKGEGKEGLGNYLHIQPGSCFYGGGAYFMEPAGLRSLRERLAADPAAFRKILAKVEKEFSPLQGEKLKRGPAGYEKDHPAMDLLLYTQMWISKQFPDKLAMSRELVDWIVEMSRKSLEFNIYLHDAIRG
ncbi:MAG: DUF2461 domain-containing protein [Bacteroidetes bacterium]|nr:DUF2461 domain-containing protein [Bacteroidota bacterium]